MSLLAVFVAAHVAVILTWVVVVLLCVGVGLLYRACFTRQAPDAVDWLLTFWIGYATVLLLLQLWHLAFAVTIWATLAVAAIGVAGLWVERGHAISWLRARSWRKHLVATIVFAILTIWAANRSLGPAVHVDSGMYHFATVDWLKAFAVVPGIGNLHSRLAFNSSSFLFAAMLDVGPWGMRSHHVANGVFAVMLFAQGLVAWARLVRPAESRNVADVFDAAAMVALAQILIGDQLSSVANDLSVSFVLVILTSWILRAYGTSAADRVRDQWPFAATVFLVATAVTIKLSAAASGAVLLILALWRWRETIFGGEGRWFGIRFRRFAGAFAIPTFLLVVWMGRGVIMSGYPLYPFAGLRAPVEWRLPVEQAAMESDWVTIGSQRFNNNRTLDGDWFGPWVGEVSARLEYQMMVPVPLFLAAALAGWLVYRMRTRGATEDVRDGLPVLLVPAAGVVFWWVMAPHPRFGAATLWTLCALLLALIAATTHSAPFAFAMRARRIGLGLGMGFATLLLLQAVWRPVNFARPRARAALALGGLVVRPGPDHGAHPVPAPALMEYTTSHGLSVAVPASDNLCWRSTLLCTPHPSPDLRLRDARSLAAGFLADSGAWRPLRWPNPWTPFMAMWRCQRGRRADLPQTVRECEQVAARTPVDTLLPLLRPYGARDATAPASYPRP